MPKQTKRASKKPKKAPAEEVPDWVNNTPEMVYTMEVFSGEEINEQINVSLDEYKVLKQHLAKMRGIAVAEEVHA